MSRIARPLSVLILSVLCAGAAQDASSRAASEQRLEWWREARFGMFIHWGLYAVPAGEWKGQPVRGIGEWIMNRARIPVAEYEQLAKQFNPVKFDAEAWVRVAKEAGMKYIVITSKHHDGFAMFRSKVSPYNIVDATPFGRDPMKELAAACQKAGIRLCFYYSQTQDWHEPDGAGNRWDWPDESKKDFAKYLEEKCKPQVRELLTQYGPIGLIWFDTPQRMTREQSLELSAMVHQLQPKCIVSGRVGNGVGDYDSAGDNQISVGTVRRDWETPVTLNDTWGFKKDDHNWKSTATLIHQLAQVTGRGGNYLLNVGPTAEGVIPQPSVDRLLEVGKWMKANSPSVYGTQGSPFPYEFEWGSITTKPGRMYLHVFDWPASGELSINGIRSKVKKAYLLAGNQPLKVKQSMKAIPTLTVAGPASAPDPNDSVIVLDIDGTAQAEKGLLQQPDESVNLPAYLATAAGDVEFDSRGVTQRWLEPKGSLTWDFQVARPGSFAVVAVTSEQKDGRNWEGGHRVAVEVAGQSVKDVIDRDGKSVNPRNPYWPYVTSNLGTVKLAKAGSYKLSFQPEQVENAKKLGLTLVSVRLVPAK